MPLTQQQAIDIIKAEREYQDKNFDPNDKLPSGLTRAQRDSEVNSHIDLILGYAQDAQSCWVFNKKTTNIIDSNRQHDPETGNLAALQQIAKIAAIALRALERVGFSEKLLEKGLR